MNRPLQIFMEYKIKDDSVETYEGAMKKVLKALEENEASDIHWYKAADQGSLYVEMFKVPTMSHYNEIKEKRRDEQHPVFGHLEKYVDGGLKKVHCWAFIEKN
ncbi:hypothetical protein J2S74_004308 [Evansella vedderi]|uniref:ABM domain-containing protein n=1 Tax=Evansella vedderi TaxID=38282 RepID=A0ABU0A1N2_9BACI|nr:hypothetical protein [Evansella vedderi]MDQ0256886.1 hypothetical protein [Evansella vedderi]